MWQWELSQLNVFIQAQRSCSKNSKFPLFQIQNKKNPITHLKNLKTLRFQI